MGLFSKKPSSEELTGAVVLAVIAGDENAIANATQAFREHADFTYSLMFLHNLTRQMAPVLRSVAEDTRLDLSSTKRDAAVGAAVAGLSEALLVEAVSSDDLVKVVKRHLNKDWSDDTKRMMVLGAATATGRTFRRLGITPRFR